MGEDEEDEIMVKTLASFGIPIAPCPVKDLSPEKLFSICSHSLRIITSDTTSFPTALPESTSDQVNACSSLATAVKRLGYVADLTPHQFLYPSEDDKYKLVRFLVGKLSESSATPKSADKKGSNENVEDVVHPLAKLDDLSLKNEVVESFTIEQDGNGESHESNCIPQKMEVVTAADNQACNLSSIKGKMLSLDNGGIALKKFLDLRYKASGNGEFLFPGVKQASDIDPFSTSQVNFKMIYEIEELRVQENLLSEEVMTKSSELQTLEQKHELLQAALEMVFSEQNSVESAIAQLNEQLNARRRSLGELESNWYASIKPLEKKKITLEEALCEAKPEYKDKYQKLKETELEAESILSEVKKRDEENFKLSAELEKQPKMESRKSHIERIKEITKNSWKLDIDIERILKETRELQLESNSIQERLHRTYAVVDETVTREAKKDQVGQRAHRLLTGIHNNFEQISEKILATDRTRREVADYEAKLSAMASKSLNADKLQADLEAIRKENEILQSSLRDT